MEPFTVAVPDAVLDDLHARLDRTRLPNQVNGAGWEQGTDRDYLVELLDHWRHRYDWRATEARLNAVPQLVTDVDGQRIHLLHAPVGEPPTPLPLLLTHGWPGSVMEFLDVLGPLTEDFHVVAPSLPGFTFSGETSERGWHPRRIAGAFAELMAGLGYERYGLQGGDWGSLVSANLADLHPERVVGLHLNMVTAATRVDGRAGDRGGAGRPRGGGPLATHRHRLPGDPGHPAAVARLRAAGLTRRLAAWIVEKFREWSHGDIAEAFTFDRLLDNITAYWVTGTAASSLRIYWEMRQARRAAVPAARIEVPTCVAQFPGEISYPPRAWTEAAYNVVRWSTPAQRWPLRRHGSTP